MRELELLSPAGSLEIFKTVIDAGADAVYFGGSKYSARSFANNLSMEESKVALDYAHLHGKKAYLTLNTLIKNKEFNKDLFDYIKFYYENGLDAIIVQDFGVFNFVREFFPDLTIHASTQMAVCSELGAGYLKELGAIRVVPARELSLKEIKNIYDKTGMEIEVFCHGALCYSYSGECLMSSVIGGRSGNRGRCAQPCRLEYDVLSDGKCLNKDKYVLSLKDLNGINDIAALANAGVCSYKIEGRMKQKQYAANVVNVYRRYLDIMLSQYDGKGEFKPVNVSSDDKKLLFDLGNRCGFTNDYYYKHNSKDMITLRKPNHENKSVDFSYEEEKLPLYCKFIGKVGTPVGVHVSFGDIEIVKNGNVCEIAKQQAVSKEDLAKRLNKTKATSFEFEKIDFEIDDNIFVSLGEVNRLRREAIEELQEHLLSKQKRTIDNLSEQEFIKRLNELQDNKQSAYDAAKVNPVQVSFKTYEQLKGWLNVDNFSFKFDLHIDYSLLDIVDFELLRNKFLDSKIFITFPIILRKNAAKYLLCHMDKLNEADGYVISSYDGLAFVKENKLEGITISNHYLYEMNNFAIQYFDRQGIDYNIANLELNRKELKHRNNQDSFITVYGKYPLMITANCINKNFIKCDKTCRNLKLKDRKAHEFSVINDCKSCYNTIYNDLPTCLFREFEDITSYGHLISFTDETAKEVEEVILEYNKCCIQDERSCNISEYTTGHYKRGVD